MNHTNTQLETILKTLLEEADRVQQESQENEYDRGNRMGKLCGLAFAIGAVKQSMREAK